MRKTQLAAIYQKIPSLPPLSLSTTVSFPPLPLVIEPRSPTPSMTIFNKTKKSAAACAGKEEKAKKGYIEEEVITLEPLPCCHSIHAICIDRKNSVMSKMQFPKCPMCR